jgi:L-lactate dehydrogenase complex protein LldE
MLRAMRVGLFVPCYVDQLRPDVGIATAEVLERFGASVDFPEAQTCCGQPLSTAGFADHASVLARRFLDVFEPFEHVVAPSGSCVAMVRRQYARLLGDSPERLELTGRVRELCEFLTDVLGVERVEGSFPHRVGLHPSCHGLRELGLALPSERTGACEDKVRRLLASLDGIELPEPERRDECCGFGGSFSFDEPEVAAEMGRSRLRAHQDAGAEVLTSVDVSCLLHLESLARRAGQPLRVMHVAEILAGRTP